MSQRIDEVSAKFSPSSPIDLEVSVQKNVSLLIIVTHFHATHKQNIKKKVNYIICYSPQSAEMELSLLDPDVATLISRGDSLVLQVQKVDLERALRINTTTGELRAGRTSLKASSEVTRKSLEFFRYFPISEPN